MDDRKSLPGRPEANQDWVERLQWLGIKVEKRNCSAYLAVSLVVIGRGAPTVAGWVRDPDGR